MLTFFFFLLFFSVFPFPITLFQQNSSFIFTQSNYDLGTIIFYNTANVAFLNDSPTLPYQKFQINNQTSMSIFFEYSVLSFLLGTIAQPSAQLVFNSEIPLSLLPDLTYSYNITTSSILTSAKAHISLTDSTTSRRLNLVLTSPVLLPVSGRFSCGGLSYGYLIPCDAFYCDLTLMSVKQNFTGTINLAELSVCFLKVKGIAYGTQKIKKIAHSVEINQLIGRVDFNFKPTRSCVPLTQLTPLADFTIMNIRFEYDPYCLNKSQVFVSGSYINMTRSNFLFTKNSLNAYHYVAIGYVNNTWVTAKANYSLPFPVRGANTSLTVNFSYKDTSTVPSGRAACVIAILRNDFNSQTQNFNPTQLTPLAEIFVCPTYNLSRIGSVPVVIDGIAYEKLTFNGDWISYTYIPAKPANLSNFNLSLIIDDAVKNDSSLESSYVAALQAGFRAYNGSSAFQFVSVNFSTIPLPLVTLPLISPQIDQDPLPISCLFSQYSQTTKKCQANDVVANSVGAVVSVPNLGLIMRLTPFILIIDDFSYFVYHNAPYDLSFKYAIDLCWNWTHSKWQPPSFITDVFNMTTDSSQSKWIVSNQKDKITPGRLKWHGGQVYFLNNARGFLLYTTPLSLVMFSILWWISRKLRMGCVSVIFRPFSSWGYFGLLLIGDNAQFLSFNCFQQFYSFAPVGSRLLLSVLNLTTSIITLFTIVICSISLYLLSPKFFRSQFEHPLFGKKPLSLLTSSALLSFKVLNGFLHALIDDSETRIILIFCTQLLVLIVTALGYGDVKSKFVFASQVFGQIVKSVLYGLLCVEVVLSDRIRENSVFIVWLANNMFFLVLVGFACVLCPIVLKIFVEVFRRKLSKKKQNSIKVFPKAIQKINRKRSIEKERQMALNKYRKSSQSRNSSVEKCVVDNFFYDRDHQLERKLEKQSKQRQYIKYKRPVRFSKKNSNLNTNKKEEYNFKPLKKSKFITFNHS